MKRRDEVQVGILITVAVVVLLAGVLWLARGGLTSGYPLYTRFAWGQNLKQGQPVLLAGVNIGYVDDVELRPDGYLGVALNINRRYKVPKTARATVHQISFFGDMAVALTPRVGSDLTVAFAPGDSIPAGAPEVGVSQIMSEADSISIAMGKIIAAFKAQVIDAGGLRDLRNTIASTSALAVQLQRIAAEQNDNLTRTLSAYQQVARAIDTAQVDSTVKSFRASSQYVSNTAAKLDTAASRLNDLLAKANNDHGSLGLLLSDSTLYRNLRNSLASADSLLADIKAHPGRYISVHIF